MKILGLVIPAVLLLAMPAAAVEYHGQNLDGKNFAAKVYNYGTGGVYNVQVRFKNKQAAIYFDDGSKITIRLRQRVITNLNDIEGFGKIGYFPIGGIFSIGLDNSNTLVGNGEPQQQNPLEGFWRISINKYQISSAICPTLREAA